MTGNEERTFVERHYGEPPAPDDDSVIASRSAVATRPTATEMLRRGAIVCFGVIQLVIALRVLLLLVGAREAAPAVAWIMNVSGALISPFEGILRHNTLALSSSVLDLTAVVAFVGWTLVEVVVLAILGVLGGE